MVWDVGSGHELRKLEGHFPYAVHAVALSRDGRLAVSSAQDKRLKVWEVGSGHELRTLEGHSDTVARVALSGDGRVAVSTSHDKTLKVWDVESGRELRTVEGHSGAVALSEDRLLAISASVDHNTLKVWEVESGHELRTLEGHSDTVSGVALNGDGRVAVSTSHDKTLKVWEVASGVLLATFTCDAAALCCAFINDRHVIAGDAGGRIHFLELMQKR
jgi:WD40 repeat protein